MMLVTQTHYTIYVSPTCRRKVLLQSIVKRVVPITEMLTVIAKRLQSSGDASSIAATHVKL